MKFFFFQSIFYHAHRNCHQFCNFRGPPCSTTKASRKLVALSCTHNQFCRQRAELVKIGGIPNDFHSELAHRLSATNLIIQKIISSPKVSHIIFRISKTPNWVICSQLLTLSLPYNVALVVRIESN